MGTSFKSTKPKLSLEFPKEPGTAKSRLMVVRCEPKLFLLYTAVSRKVVGRNAHSTIPKGNMGYDQYTVRDD